MSDFILPSCLSAVSPSLGGSFSFDFCWGFLVQALLLKTDFGDEENRALCRTVEFFQSNLNLNRDTPCLHGAGFIMQEQGRAPLKGSCDATVHLYRMSLCVLQTLWLQFAVEPHMGVMVRGCTNF